eukprot:481171-Pelagomonas_calceolata.AAC.1
MGTHGVIYHYRGAKVQGLPQLGTHHNPRSSTGWCPQYRLRSSAFFTPYHALASSDISVPQAMFHAAQ